MKHVLLILMILVSSWQALAIPAFARKFNFTCTTCHTAFPMLNKFGRTFKERGYSLPDGNGTIDEDMQNHQKLADSLVLEKMLPLAIRVQTIGADLAPANPDASGVQYQFTPIKDLGLLAFGNFFQSGSFMIIAEAGSPDDGAAIATAFDFGVTARFATHPSVYFNMASGYAPLFAIDPYPSLMSVDDPISIHSRKLLNVSFSDDNSISFADPMPFAAVYGRAGKLYYSASISSGRNTIAAVNPQVGQARLAFDLTDTLEIGAFGVGGTATLPNAPDSKLWLAGVDTNWSTQQYIFSAIGRATGGEGNSAGTNTNWGASAEFIYIVQKDNLPFLLPIARVEWLQANAGSSNQVSGFLGLAAFVRQNVRVGIDTSADILAVTDVPRQWRATLYGDFVF